MKQAASILIGSILLTTSAWAAAPEPGRPGPPVDKSPGWQPAPTSVGGWADRCTDFTINSWGFKDPKNFVRLIELYSNPAIYL
ncbi:MAG: hypothetical protein WBX11_14165 [Thiobacillaceae bacterium]